MVFCFLLMMWYFCVLKWLLFPTTSLTSCRLDSLQKNMEIVGLFQAGSSALKLVEREVAILKRVNHPNIINLNEVIESPKVHSRQSAHCAVLVVLICGLFIVVFVFVVCLFSQRHAFFYIGFYFITVSMIQCKRVQKKEVFRSQSACL